MEIKAADQLIPSEELEGLKDQIRKQPADPKLRIYLFQLLSVCGDWDGAIKQLKVLKDLDDSTSLMVQAYSQIIQCELFREEVFQGHKQPLVFGEPNRWIALLSEALKLTAQNQFEQAAKLRDEAFELAPAVSGKMNDQAFAWLADADPRMGPVLEVFLNGKYYWVPMQCIKSVMIEPPQDLRDLIWTPAAFTWANGGEAMGFIPTRYPGSYQAQDPDLQTSRKTEWDQKPNDYYFGRGQRMFTDDSKETALLDVRSLTFDT